jgi:ethylene receptor
MRAGVNGLVLKPVSVEKMKGVLTELLERRFVFETI